MLLCFSEYFGLIGFDRKTAFINKSGIGQFGVGLSFIAKQEYPAIVASPYEILIGGGVRSGHVLSTCQLYNVINA